MHEALTNAAEQFVAHAADERKKGDTKGLDAGMLDYFAEIFGEALAKPQPVGGALTDERIDEIQREWIAQGGSGSRGFARIIEREVLATLSAPVAQPPKCETCNDNGMIGGPSYYAPDEGGEPCPDCTPAALPAEVEPMRKHVEDFATAAGWKRDDGEGAFEFVQRTSYHQGWQDGRREGMGDVHRDTPEVPAQAAAVPEAVERDALREVLKQLLLEFGLQETFGIRLARAALSQGDVSGEGEGS